MSIRPGVTYRPATSTVLTASARIDVRRHGGDLAVFDGDVADGADAILRIDDVAALQQQVVLGLLLCKSSRGQHSGPE